MMIARNDKITLLCDYCIDDAEAIGKNDSNRDVCFICLLEDGLI